ncbi:MAG TPA: hypothetical protein VKX28_23680, partial [Xanthobacteraceae bacterium]|nr:hypothetical protein [Xanthobacteraceae bacterium]
QRPSAAEWGRHFHDILEQRQLERCSAHPNDPAHIHFMGKPCAACHLERSVAASTAAQVTAPLRLRSTPLPLPRRPPPPPPLRHRPIVSALSLVLALVSLCLCVAGLSGLLPGAHELSTILDNPRPQVLSLEAFLAHGSQQPWVTITDAYVNVRQGHKQQWPTDSDGPLLPLVTYDSGDPSQKSDLFVARYGHVVAYPVCDRYGRAISLDGYFDPDSQPKWDRRRGVWSNYNQDWGCYPVPNYRAEPRTLSGMLSTVDEKSALWQAFHDRGVEHPTILKLGDTPPSLDNALFHLGAGAVSFALGAALLFFLYRRKLIFAS